MVYSLFQAEYVLIVQNSETYPHWIGMIYIFQPYVWYVSFCFCLLVSGIIWCMAKVTGNETSIYTKAHNIVFTVAAIMVSSVPRRAPKAAPIRYIFVLWCIFCLNWMSAYTSSLISMITTPLHKNQAFISIQMRMCCNCYNDFSFQISTLSDIFNRKMGIGGGPVTYNYFQNEPELDVSSAEIKQTLELCQPLDICFQRVASNRYEIFHLIGCDEGSFEPSLGLIVCI